MKHLTVTIPDDFYNTFVAFFKHIPEVKISENQDLRQEDLVLKRIEEAQPEDYKSWEEVKKELDKKWNFNG